MLDLSSTYFAGAIRKFASEAPLEVIRLRNVVEFRFNV